MDDNADEGDKEDSEIKIDENVLKMADNFGKTNADKKGANTDDDDDFERDEDQSEVEKYEVKDDDKPTNKNINSTTKVEVFVPEKKPK